MSGNTHSGDRVLKLGSWISGVFVPHNYMKTTYAESTLMETPNDEILPNNGTRHAPLPVRACQLDFCGAKSVNWSRVYSMNKARQMDQWLELKTDGFEHAMNRTGKSIYVCKKHLKEAEARKQENVVGFLRLVEKDVAEFCGDAIVSDVSDSRKLFPKKDKNNKKKKTSFLNDDSISEDVKPSVMEVKQLLRGALDGTADGVSTRDNNGNGMEIPKEENVADNRPKRVARTCQLEFCRTKSINYMRLYSMTKARQLDHWLGLHNDGFEQALKSTGGKNIHFCTKHTEEAEIRKQQQILASFLREFGDSRVSGVQDDDSCAEDVKPSVMNEMMHDPASETEKNTKKSVIEVLRTNGPRCVIHGVPTKAEEIALRLCYWKCLKSAVDRRLLRIGFPLIGTGLGGYPRSEGLVVALDTILAFFETNPVKGLNVSICVSGDGARDVLEFGAILMGKELSFKLEKHTVHRVRSTIENVYAKLMGLSDQPRKAYELLPSTTTISFPTYVMKDEETGRGNPYRKRKRTGLREGKPTDDVKLEPLDEIQDDQLFRETKENMTQLVKQMPENPDCSTSNDVAANLFGPSETADRVRLLKEEEVEKVDNNEQKPPCLNPE